MSDPVRDFRAEMCGRGPSYDPGDAEVVADGRIHRFHAADDHAGKKNGWYVLHANTRSAGTFGNWKTGERFSWSVQPEFTTALDRTEIEAAKAARKREEKLERENAKARAGRIWFGAKAADPAHPYLIRKRIRAHGVRELGDKLVVPLPLEGELVGLQFITANGSKRYMKGTAPRGAYFLLGEPGAILCVAEGFATAASVFEATGYATCVAFSAGNLLPAATSLHEAYPAAQIVIAADDDVQTKGNPGLTYARAAARANGGLVALPHHNGEEPSASQDFSDLLVSNGPGAVKAAIDAAKTPPPLSSDTEDKQRIAELAALDAVAYDRVRKEAAKELRVRTETLDEMVRAKRPKALEGEVGGGELMFAVAQPWPDPVNGAALLDDLVATIGRFVIMGKHAVVAVALWIVFTYLIGEVQVAPILAVISPEKRCGKTTLLDLLTRLGSRALASSNISPSALFRVVETFRPTLVIDEADSFVDGSEELRGLLNSGHTRTTAFVIRNVGDDHEPRRFATWGAKALASIGRLPDTVEDRSIVVNLRRKLTAEKTEKLRHSDSARFTTLIRRCERWATDQAGAIKRARSPIPEELNDRAADNWEPLLAIADLAGSHWPGKAREAAVLLSGVAPAADSVRVELLADIRAVLLGKGLDRIGSEALVEEVCADETRRWATYNKGKRISQRQVASLLRWFNVVPNTVRIGDKTLRGYQSEWFSESFARYLPTVEPQQRHKPSQVRVSEDLTPATDLLVLHVEEPPEAASDGVCGVVAHRNGETGGEVGEVF